METPTSATAIQGGEQPGRLAYFDNLRTVLTALVVVHHAAIAYSDIPMWYYIEPVHDHSAKALDILLVFDQMFFMGFFFLISGYFVPTSCDRKGAGKFLRDRLIRLGIPLLLFIFVLNPILSEDDYLAFEQVMKLAHEQVPMRVLGWCLMPSHWHLVLWPRADGELTAFLRKLTHTHAQRWKTAHDAVGHGHLYQGRFKSFPVQTDEHLLTLLRYVERNPLRGKLVQRVQDWPWGSYAVRRQPKHALYDLLWPWPVKMPADWTRRVNTAQTPEEQKALAEHIRRNRPLGDDQWTIQTASKLGLQQSIRPVGRQIGWRKNKAEMR